MKEEAKPWHKTYVPGEGLRSMNVTGAFRSLNFELYVKPNKWIRGLNADGLIGNIGDGYLDSTLLAMDFSQMFDHSNVLDCKLRQI